MKHEKLRTFLTAVLLGTVLGICIPGCIMTAFDLPVTEPSVLFSGCVLAAVVWAGLFSLPHGGAAFLCLAVLSLTWLWREGDLQPQLLRLISRLTTLYDRAYGWGIPLLPEQPDGMVELPLLLIGIPGSAGAAWCVCRRSSAWLPVLASLAPLSLCIVVTDTVPDEKYLFGALFVLVLLVFTGALRMEDGPQSLRLTSAAAIAVAAALAALFLFIPQKDYVNRSALLRENILTAARNLPQLLENGAAQTLSHLRGREPRQVTLQTMGQRIPFTYPVMEVTAETGGTLYLRGQDYVVYNGLGWSIGDHREEPFHLTGEKTGTITVQTPAGKQLRYLPYYPSEETILSDGSSKNPGASREYRISHTSLPENWRLLAYGAAGEAAAELTEEDRQAYLSLPASTQAGAATILAELPVTGSATAKADTIAAFVTDCARYDLNTGKMPAEEEDFALWFLEDGETGYCVHFATAATVLLRAADVPARYVTGYLVETAPGETAAVTEENAHAWAEYYEPLLGVWIPLEATPSSDPEPAPPAATLQTQPVQSPEETTSVTPTIPEQTSSSTQPPPASLPEPPEQPEVPAKPSTEWLKWLKAGASVILAVCLLALQRRLRLELRRKTMRTGSANRQALARWREAERLSRLLKESPTEELMVLAQKAKFSHHEITPQELVLFDSFHRSCLRRLRERPWYLRLVYRFVYAVF